MNCKACLCLALLPLLAGAETIQPGADTLPGDRPWKLVWQDEFDGERIDPEKWEVVDGPRRGHRWDPATASLDGKGHLVMETRKREDGSFASPCLRTKGRYTKVFGYFVMRCRLPVEEGHWSAFWLYNRSVGSVGKDGRDGTEIDIMEWPWRDGRVQHTLHWDGYGRSHKSKGQVVKPTGVLDGAFHTFALWWKPDEYVFYVDGKETWRTKAGGVCQVPLYLKLSEEIGVWAGDIKQAKLPDRFVIDYVRVYDTEKN